VQKIHLVIYCSRWALELVSDFVYCVFQDIQQILPLDSWTHDTQCGWTIWHTFIKPSFHWAWLINIYLYLQEQGRLTEREKLRDLEKARQRKPRWRNKSPTSSCEGRDIHTYIHTSHIYQYLSPTRSVTLSFSSFLINTRVCGEPGV